MGKFIVVKNFKCVVGEFSELADAQAAAVAHAKEWGYGEPVKWSFRKKTMTWWTDDYTIRFEA